MNLDLIYELVPINTTWRRGQDGFDLHQGNDDTYIYSVLDSELARIDPRLPAAIQMLPDADRIGLKIRTMLGIWDFDIYLESVEGRKVAVLGVEDFDVKSTVVTLTGYGCYYNEQLTPSSGDVVLLPEEPYVKFDLSRTWLDATFPHWEQRYKVARDLDMNPTLAVRAMLEGANIVSNPDLPDGLSV